MSEKTLSIFIDESGDFGPYQQHAPFYLVSMVLHDQSFDLTPHIQHHNQHLNLLGWDYHAIHTGPLIRRENQYSQWTLEERKALFGSLFHLIRKLPIHYITANIKKEENSDAVAYTLKLSKSIRVQLEAHKEFFQQYDHIIVYYDNGQIQLTKILGAVFGALVPQSEFRMVRPIDYKLFQVADLICTMELLSLKDSSIQLSKWETQFFDSRRTFQKNYLRPLQKKKL